MTKEQEEYFAPVAEYPHRVHYIRVVNKFFDRDQKSPDIADVETWCCEHIDDRWAYFKGIFCFKNEQDKLHFIFKWVW
jgi:hypothetical protein